MHVAIHSGVAFTDADLLLKSLHSNADMLKERGMVLYGPRRYRQAFKTPLNALETDMPPGVDGLRQVLPEDPAIDRAILSCPDYVGEVQTAIRDGQYYPRAGARMSFLAKAFEGHKIHLHLGLRNPASFIPKALMALPEQDRQSLLATTDLSCLSWLTMIEDIRELAPDVDITLWANEDSPLIWGDIIRSLCGLTPDVRLIDEFALLSTVVSPEGQRRLRSLEQQQGPVDRSALRNQLEAVFRDHALGEEIEEELELPGWTTEIIAAFSELYVQDLARLETMPGVRLLRHRAEA